MKLRNTIFGKQQVLSKTSPTIYIRMHQSTKYLSKNSHLPNRKSILALGWNLNQGAEDMFQKSIFVTNFESLPRPFVFVSFLPD
jgi:hypothetical protein